MKDSLSHRIALVLVLMAAALLCLADAVQIRTRPDEGQSVVLLIEPEQNNVFHPRTQPHQSRRTSGGGFVSIEGWNIKDPEYGQKIAGETAYPVRVPAPGVYQVWVRTRWAGPCANSVTLLARRKRAGAEKGFSAQRHADTNRHLVGNDMTQQVWHWVRGPQFTLDAEEYELLLGTREANAAVDCILLTSDLDSLPADTAKEVLRFVKMEDLPGLPEDFSFTENFTTVTDQSEFTSTRWLPDNSDWRTRREPGIGAVGPCAPGVALAQAITPPLTDVHIQCAVSVSPRFGAGIFFGKRSDDDYFVARFAGRHASKPYAGKIQAGRQEGATFNILGEADCVVSQDMWERIDVWTCGRFCSIHLGGKPVLNVRLPRSALGYAGLYVDGEDRMLRLNETLPEIDPTPAQMIRARKDDTRGRDLIHGWGGLALGCTPDQCYVARWTNIASNGSYAKRFELVRARASGKSDLLARRWNLFNPSQRSQLALRWHDGTLTASLGDDVLCEADVTLASNLAGIIHTDRPRALFGDFTLRSLEIQSSPKQVEHMVTKAQALGRSGPDIRTDDAERESLTPISAGSERSSAVVTTRLHRGDLPCAVSFQLHPDGSEHKLRVKEEPPEGIRLSLEHHGRNIADKIVKTASDAESDFVLQLVFDQCLFQAFLDGGHVFDALRDTTSMVSLSYLSRGQGGAVPVFQVTNLPDVRDWYSLGYGWPAEDITGRVLHGDASIQLIGSYRPGGGNRTVQLHADREQQGSGYEMEIASGVPPSWRLLRNGVQIASGTLPMKLGGGRSVFSLCQYGPVLCLHDGRDRPFYAYLDPDPLREGYACGGQRFARHSRSRLQVDLRQFWDSMCLFHPEMLAASSSAMWQVSCGRWELYDSPDGLDGALCGYCAPNWGAAIRYRGAINDVGLLVEVRMNTGALPPRARLKCSFELDGATDKSEDIELYRSAQNELMCVLRRNHATAQGSILLDLSRPSPVLTLLRTETKLTAELDHCPMAELLDSSTHLVRGVTLAVDGRAGREVLIRSISLQRDPLSPDRVPQQLRTYLAFLRDALASDIVQNSE